MPKRSLICVAVLVGAFLMGFPLTGWAGTPAGEWAREGDMCATCHATPGLEISYPNGDKVSATVDPAVFAESVHGSELQCTACHEDVPAWPHLDVAEIQQGARDQVALLRSAAICGKCHAEEYQSYLGSSHARALADGKTDSAVCSDCHGNHDIQPANSAKTGLAMGPAVQSCSECHEEEYAQYSDSVHGRALVANGDIHAPACVDCHGVHDITSPKAAEFRRDLPNTCATCHADEKLMAEYGISTAVFNTYVADFHGASMQLYGAARKGAPEQATCSDCHGAHSIAASADPKSLAVSENVQQTCQQCHEDANTRFPAAWLGHSVPSPTQAPLVFWIGRVYIIVIVISVGALIIHILLDLLRFVRDHRRGRTAGHA